MLASRFLVAVWLLTAAAPAQPPVPRSCHAMAYLPSHKGIVAFGGSVQCGRQVHDDRRLWLWSGAEWTSIAEFPDAREDALLVFDSARRRLVLFGGRNGSVVHQDTWEFDGSAWSRRAEGAGGPGPLEHAGAAFDEQRRQVVLFGGGSRSGAPMSRRTWTWDGVTWKQASESGPAARVGHSMAWSSALGGVALYGGFNESASPRDLWLWNGKAWTLVHGAGPTPTEGPALAAGADGLLLVGTGVEDPQKAPDARLNVWRWHERDWVRASSSDGPAARIGQSLAYDAARQTIVLWGGAGAASGPSPDVWEFSKGAWRRRP